MKKIKSFLIMAILLCIAWPAQAKIYTVVPGDTLGRIAKANGSSIFELARINGIKNVNIIMVDQKIEVPEKGTEKNDRRKVFAVGLGYAHVYRHEMGNPFAPRVNGVQKKLTAKEYARHMSNIMRHGVSQEGARSILAAKENNLCAGDIYLPDGTIVKSVSFRKNKVWTGGVLIEVKSGGIHAKLWRAWTGEIILDALNCGNYISPREVYVPKGNQTVEQQVEAQQEKSTPVIFPEMTEAETEKPPCSKCHDDLETDTGVYLSSGLGGGKGSIRGKGVFGEMIYWKNFAEDCSSEYYWGLGILGSLYEYNLSDLPSQGDGGRFAGQFGIKRVWADKETGLARQWIVKGRAGFERSHWENPDRDWHINQVGPVIGEYAEYRRELVYDTLWGFVTVESWLGLGNQSIGSSFSDTSPSSRTYTEALVGLDYKFARTWVLRGYAGLDYEGWDYWMPGVAGAEVRHELKNDWGTVALGVQAKIYSAINPVGLLCVKWEITKPIEKWYDNHRQNEVKLVGYGIGGNQFQKTTKQKTNQADHMKEVMNSISCKR